jgi:uncharacterized protein YodC (DUF2158 family)
MRRITPEENIAPGAIVQLRSGGPPTTVRYEVPDVDAAIRANKPLGVHCDWCDFNGVPQNAAFSRAQLLMDLD